MIIHLTLNWGGNVTEPIVSSVGIIQALDLASNTVMPSVMKKRVPRN
jgi:hypothetical protein